MPLIKPITAPNGAAVAFHKVMNFSGDPNFDTLAVNVASWTDEDSHNAGTNLVWMWPMDMPPASIADLDGALAATAPFDGATRVTDESQSLAAVQDRQCAALEASYAQAIATNVAFTTAAGAAQTYQCNPGSVQVLTNCIVGWGGAQAVPADFYFPAADNTRVPFTYADLQGLAAAFVTAGHAAWALLQDLKAAVRAATTTAAVRAVVWPSPP